MQAVSSLNGMAEGDIAAVQPQRGPEGWENWHALAAGKPYTDETAELACYSDSHLIGEIRDGLGPFQLLNTVPGGTVNPQPGAIEPTLVIRIDVHDDYENTYQRDEWSKIDATSYHGGGVGDELSALLSLALGIRLRNGGMTRVFGSWAQDDPRGKPVESGHERPSIVAPTRGRPAVLPGIARANVNLEEARKWLTSYTAPQREDAIALVRAARQYEQAVWISDAAPGISWLQFVSAVEVAAVHWREYRKSTPIDRLRAASPKIAEIIEPAGDDVLREVASFLAPQLRATDRFLKFLAKFAPPPPEARPQHARLDWDNLQPAFREIYARRSEALHGGIPIPSAMCNVPRSFDESGAYEETMGAIGAWSGTAYWPASAVPMYLNTFEYIARGALLTWWRRLAEVDALAGT